MRLVAASLVTLLAIGTAPAYGADPPAGTITPDTSVSWTGSFPDGGNRFSAQCFGPDGYPNPTLTSGPLFYCDLFALDVVVPDGFWVDHTGGADVAMTPSEDANLDLYVYERHDDGRAGTLVGWSVNQGSAPERVTVPKAEGGYYVGVVAAGAPEGTTYTASASITYAPGPDVGPPVEDPPPQVVTALIDTGINPYHLAFRDPDPLAQLHPARYMDGYPKEARELSLTLDAPTLEDALVADAQVWDDVEPGVLYWVPGTRIVGLISLGPGGTRCAEPDFFPFNGGGPQCPERLLLDDHGHGTMTASRAAGGVPDGEVRSLGYPSRIVAIEGLGGHSVQWAADQSWIDVQSNSWAELVPHTPVSNVNRSFAEAARRQLVFAASGNGAGGFFGFAPHPTYAVSTGAPDVLVVGAHDNGRIAHWSGAPAHVVADGYAGWTAAHDSLDRYEPDSVACCTSAAAPYAAGGAAHIVLEARRILGGTAPGVLASGPEGLVAGPLADGDLTLEEARRLLRHSAEARPREGRDDGLVQWAGDPRPPDQLDRGPAGNPYCNGCHTLPVLWSDVPDAVPAYMLIGYGAVNERSVALAAEVMRGAQEPDRGAEDTFFGIDQAVRSTTSAR